MLPLATFGRVGIVHVSNIGPDFDIGMGPRVQRRTRDVAITIILPIEAIDCRLPSAAADIGLYVTARISITWALGCLVKRHQHNSNAVQHGANALWLWGANHLINAQRAYRYISCGGVRFSQPEWTVYT